MTKTGLRNLLLSGAASVWALSLGAGAAQAEDAHQFDIESQPLARALLAFNEQSGVAVAASRDLVEGKYAPAVRGEMEPRAALELVLAGSGLKLETASSGYVVLAESAEDPQSRTVLAQAETETSTGRGREKIIVTGQKREEYIQDVPIAISAFSMEDLQAQKIEGGFDLLKAIPNVTFSKNNFTSYNFSIRGVGTKAVSATTDPGVAVAFNNSAIIQNRLFEQEYYDIERVEVLRGPQGTLYGRNATSGVVNVISAKPTLDEFYGQIKGEVGNFNTKRLVAHLNIPIKEDVLGIRLAGALTDRDGYDFNTTTGNPVNGRDLWSTRLSARFEPDPRFRADFVWERFEEDDDRLRTGKQLCHRDDGPDMVGDVLVSDPIVGTPGTDEYEENLLARKAVFSTGCQAGSLYDDAAFGTPNGLSYNFIVPLVSLRRIFLAHSSTAIGITPGETLASGGESIMKLADPYGGLMQSRDLREIASIRDPKYNASADLFELNVDFDLTPELTFSSQTAYVEDTTYSFQDYNRFNSQPIFNDTSQLEPALGNDFSEVAPGGIFCDPQIGCSDTLAGFDIAQAEATQFNQELRLQSSFAGPLNFSVGANYTEFETLVDYYIFFNIITALAQTLPFNAPGGVFGPGTWDPTMCAASDFWEGIFPGSPAVPVPTSDPNSYCPYVDPNPLTIGENFDGDGHNYFRSKNPYELESWAGFGEVYWNITDDLKLTGGLRYTSDTKTFIPIPSQVLLAPSFVAGGTTPIGYPEDPPIIQEWNEWTGRLVLDWQPEFDFTDETLVYGSYSRGYKGGGANPPRPGFATREDIREIFERQPFPDGSFETYDAFGIFPVLELSGDEYGATFDPEFVDAFEIGTKNTLLGGGMTFNATAFYYDYKDYQVSQIRDRTAVNENFDATTWGLEFETLFAPSEDFQIIANLGYLDTEIADGERSIDIMNRTQGDPNFTVVKPWAQLPSNCVVPTGVAENFAASSTLLLGNLFYSQMCGIGGIISLFGSPPIDPATSAPYDKALYDGTDGFADLNEGAGIWADLGGNELPNAPHWTANVGAQYGKDVFGGDWRATIRGDAYWQSQSYHRVYNAEPYDKLRGWYNVNLAFKLERPDDGLAIELYAKNVLDDTPITDAFLNSDDTGLTTNVFTLDPRLIGLSLTKEF